MRDVRLTESKLAMMKFVSICALSPLVFYDVVTSIGGGFAVFGLSNYTSPNPIILAFPIALAVGATALNFWTAQIWAESGSLALLRFAWFLFIVFDSYTTFLGIIGFMTSGGLWSFPHGSIEQAYNTLGQERFIFAAGASLIVVMSPTLRERGSYEKGGQIFTLESIKHFPKGMNRVLPTKLQSCLRCAIRQEKRVA